MTFLILQRIKDLVILQRRVLHEQTTLKGAVKNSFIYISTTPTYRLDLLCNVMRPHSVIGDFHKPT